MTTFCYEVRIVNLPSESYSETQMRELVFNKCLFIHLFNRQSTDENNLGEISIRFSICYMGNSKFA